MSAIVVCPLSRLAETVAAYRASHIVTLVNDGTLFARPPVVPAANHLHVAVHDIIEPLDGMVCPTEEHVGSLSRLHPALGPAGADRRALLRRDQPLDGGGVLRLLRRAAGRSTRRRSRFACRQRSPEATPNARLVAIADEMLGRSGRMVRAIEKIGRGVDAYEGSVFALRLDE